MIDSNYLLERHGKRRYPDWQPIPSTGKCKIRDKVTLSTLQRCVSLLDLECQVAEWLEANSKDLDDAVVFCLQRNIEDENKHFTALRHLADYLHVDPDKQNPEVEELKARWKAQPQNFATIYALEMGVFFSILPWLVRYGDTYCVTVSQWISDDESFHVTAHGHLMAALEQRMEAELGKLVVDTINFVFSELPESQRLDIAVRAVRRLLSGKDYRMSEYSVPTTTAIFEQESKKSLVYS